VTRAINWYNAGGDVMTDEQIANLISAIREVADELERDPRMLRHYSLNLRAAMDEAGLSLDTEP
jgi:hypothetical protein